MEPDKHERSIFYTDQGHLPDEYDKAEAMGYHEDEFHVPSGHIY